MIKTNQPPQNPGRFRVLWWITIAVLSAYLAPYLILGDRGSWLTWDNLDSNFVIDTVLLESGNLFSSNSEVVEQFLGGVPRGTLPSEFDAFVWLYFLLGPEGAYVANRILMTVAGFAGMFLLLKRHILPGEQNSLIHFGVAICFATLPFWPFGGLTVAGVPLLFYAALNIRSGDQRWFNWATLILYPFYSSMVTAGLFPLATLAVLVLTDFFGTKHSRQAALRLMLGLCTVSAFYVLTNYRLVQLLAFSNDFVSHREAFLFEPTSFGDALVGSLEIFIHGQQHARSLHGLIVLPVVITGAVVVFLSTWVESREDSDRLKKVYFLCVGFLIFTSFWYGFHNWSVISAVSELIRGVLPLQLQRFHWIHPTVWMILFASSLSLILKCFSRYSLICVLAIVLQLLYSVRWHEYFINRDETPVYKFFAKQQFDQIDRFIDRPKDSFRIGSLGIHPSVALYNGFFTIDGYHQNYSLEYKHRFRRVIVGELEKSDTLKNDFDNWGSRAYLFSAELVPYGLVVSKYSSYRPQKENFEIQNLTINTRELSALGAEFLISSVYINEQLHPGFRFLKKFEDANSAWDLYLYEVRPDTPPPTDWTQ